VSRYIDDHRGRSGVEPICRTLGVSASAYYRRATGKRSVRETEDKRPLGRIRELHAQNYYAYGHRRMWKALLRAGERVPRCRVQGRCEPPGSKTRSAEASRGSCWLREDRPDLRVLLDQVGSQP
jgi:HTH-like domain